MLGFVSHLNKPSAFTATSSSSSIPVHPPHQYALQLLNVRASYCTVRDGKEERSQYSRRGGDVSAYFISDSLHSKLLTFTPPPQATFSFWAINGCTLIWRASGTVSTVDWGALCCCCGCKQREKRGGKEERVMFALHRVRQFRVLSALVVGSIVCCAKR